MPLPNLISVLDSFRKFGGDPAVVQTQGCRRQSQTYGELYASAVCWSHALRARGIGPGDRVLLWGANSAAWVACFWGILLRGAIAVPMDAGASVDFVRRTVQESGAKLILRDRRQPELDASAPSSLVINDFSDGVPATGSAPENSGPGSSDHSARSAIVEILFTSGTTAEPRGVVLSQGNFLANLEPIERGVQPYRKYERWLHPLRFVSLVPLSHVFGQFMALFVPPLLGATVVFENSANPSEILRTIKRENATVLIAVPRMLDLLRGALEREIEARGWRNWFDENFAAAANQPFLRRAWRFQRIHRLFGVRFWAFISGGAALCAETELFFRRLGYAVVQGYGMTETASLITLNHPFRAAEGSVGKILAGRECKLAEDGEILVRGENVSAGYWEKGAVQPVSDRYDDWLRTGDLGELDAAGNLRFRGRKKNVIVTSAGLNVYPEDLEAALKRQAAVRDAVVVPLDRNGNAEPCAALLIRRREEVEEVKDVQEEAASAAIAGANASVAEYQRVRTWFVWPEPDFPRTPTGKPRLPVIAARASELLQPQRARHAVPLREPDGSAEAKCDSSSKNVLAQLRSSASFASSTSLTSLSSLDRVELLSALEQRYNVELNEDAFSEAKTVADLQKLIEQPNTSCDGEKSELSAGYYCPRWTQREPARWFRLMLYYALAWPATQILGHPRAVGRHHLKNVRGPLIVICNHVSGHADIGLILAALPARFRHRLAAAMSSERLSRMRTPPREWFFARRWVHQLGYFLLTLLFNVFPLPRFAGFRQSLRFAGESADRGYSVLIFPEGEVNNSADGRMVPFQPGIGLLAENLWLPVVPMRLDGVWQMKREGRRFARLGEITVHIGAPVRFPPGMPPAEIARHLECLVAAL